MTATSGKHGITRRELLKKGALVGGVAIWATPIVQSVGMGRAYAATTSPMCAIYCIVWTPSIAGAPSSWEVSDGDNCLPCPPDTTAGLPPDINNFTVTYDAPTETFTVTYPDTYALVPSGDPTPDDLVNGSAAIRQGENTGSCEYVTVDDQGPGIPPNTTQIQFGGWNNNSGIRIELVIKHCV